MRRAFEIALYSVMVAIILTFLTSKETSPLSLYRRSDFEASKVASGQIVVDLKEFVAKLHPADSDRPSVLPEKIIVVLYPACSSCSLKAKTIEEFLSKPVSGVCLILTENTSAFRLKYPGLSQKNLCE